MSKLNNKVYCASATSYSNTNEIDSAIESIFNGCEVSKQLGAHSHVLLKPNLLAKHVPEHSVTTHPQVLCSVIKACISRGVVPSNIIVADSSGGIYNSVVMKGVYQAAGFVDVCNKTGAKLYLDCEAKLSKTNGVIVKEFNLLAPVKEVDFIINLPKLKTHVMTGMTCAVKNLFGTIPGLQKAELHMRFSQKEKFGEMLVDLCQCVNAQMHIVDAVIGMEGDGPAGGTPRNVGAIFGGENPYNVDLTAARIIGIDPMRVPYLASANARGLCEKMCDEQTLMGDVKAVEPIEGYKLPNAHQSVSFADRLPKFMRSFGNAVSEKIAPRPVIDKAKCIGCKKCAEICPGHTIKVENNLAYIIPKDCIKCFCCHEMCPVKAIDVKKFGVFKL